MKKTTKYILITAVIAVLLGGILATLYFTDPARQVSEEEESSSSEVDNALFEKEEGALQQVDVKGGPQDFTLLVSYTEDEEGNQEASYAIQGYEDYTFNDTNLRGAANNFVSMSYTKEIGTEDEIDLTEFGLTEGITATATYEDGSTETLIIGGEPGETAGRYVLYNGMVYICSINQVYTSELKDQIEVASWSISDLTDESGYSYSYMDYINLSGTNFARPIRMVYDQDAFDYQMEEPIRSGGSMTFADTLVTSLASFSAGTVEKIAPTEEELAAYGLTDPYVELEFAINGEAHSITVGNKVGNQRYTYVDGDSKVVYLTDTEDISTWTEANEEKFRDGYVNILMITKVNQITVEGGGNKTVIDLARTVNEEKSTDDSTVYDYTAKRDGVDMVYKNVTKFYSELISLSILNMQETEVTGDPVLTITYGYYDGSPDSVLEFYQSSESEDRCIVYIDGIYNSTVRMSSVESVCEALEKFLALDPTVEIDSL